MLRFLAFVCGLAVGAFSVPSAFLNGFGMAPGPIGYGIGTAMLGFLGWNWLSGAFAALAFSHRAWARGSWFLLQWCITTATILGMSAGFVATNRGETVEGRQIRIERYDQAKADLQRLAGEVQAAEGTGRWKTANSLRQDIRDAQAKLEAGRPAASDAQAETLSWVTHIDAVTVAKAIPLWLSAVMDLAASSCFMAAAFRPNQVSAPVKKSKRRSKRLSRRSKPAAQAATDDRPERVSGDVIDIDAKRAQRACASWAPR